VVEPESTVKAIRRTTQGEATRTRILQAAAELMFAKGVAATRIDDVRAATRTSKSQLYHYFADKDALVQEVIAHQASELLAREDQLKRLNSVCELERWRDAILQRNALRNGIYGCPLGSLASELAHDEPARSALARHFRAWEGLIAQGLDQMQAAGKLRQDADPQRLATGLIGALQGGYLLARTAQDTTPLKITLNMAIDHIRTFQA
jgi:AcrR family transcriptional regulator